MSYDNLFWGNTDTPNHTQWKIKAESLLADRDIFHPTAKKYFPLGAIAESRDGRRWRYCENGGTALAKCLMGQGAVPTANWTEQTNTYGDAGAAKAKFVNINLTATAAAHDFIDGWLSMVDATPAAALGDLYLIKDNDVGVAATSGYTVKIYLADAGGLRNAITTATEMTVLKNLYKDIVVVPAGAPTAIPVGVPAVIVAANYFYWAQTRGPASILIDTDNVAVGDIVGEATTAGVDGAAGLIGDATDEPTWGWVMSEPTTAQTDQPAIVYLTLE